MRKQALCTKCREPLGPLTIEEQLRQAVVRDRQEETLPDAVIEAQVAMEVAEEAFEQADHEWKRANEIVDEEVAARRSSWSYDGHRLPKTGRHVEAERRVDLTWKARERAAGPLKLARVKYQELRRAASLERQMAHFAAHTQ